ncbi:GspE/PulE family protein, partial [bacterium]|nr:GspE/PulE family protein [bacterium]
FKAIYRKKSMDCRISTLPTVEGERVVMRLLQKDRLNVTLSNAGFSNYSFKVMTQLLAKPHGLILVTGPTGSGKTTTLYASLAHVWSPKKSVVTVEDPVEYEITNYAQVQVNTDVGLGFAESLRAILRQAPDIILVGEIRDGETAKIACEAAMTGHMVLSTLHANTAASSVMRLTEIGVDHYLMASVLVGALSQRLVRKLCARCRTKVALSKDLQLFANRYKLKSQFVYDSKGCTHCRGSGYVGRLGIHEVLVNGPEVGDAISRKLPPMELEAVARKKGFISLRDDAFLKVLQGLTDLKQVLKATG